jgi:glyoxylase-like metal-dependent hydrolase (beta-lactamase superfamily II)
MKFGDWDVSTLDEGLFRLDGGAMFGVVPREVWEKEHPPDDRNRIALQARVLLLQGLGRVVLVDVGMGDKWTERDRDRFGIQGTGLIDVLAHRGIAPEEVTDVVLTHLHFDHAGGLTQRVNGALVPTFPAAQVHVQRRNREWARHPSERDRGSYRSENWAPYDARHEHLLRLVDGDGEVLPGVEVFVCDGHTIGQQLVRIPGGPDGSAIVYASDIIPTAAHLRPAWSMAYDLQPLRLLEEKREIVERLTERRDWLVFEHDPTISAARIGRDERGRATVVETLDLSAG